MIKLNQICPSTDPAATQAKAAAAMDQDTAEEVQKEGGELKEAIVAQIEADEEARRDELARIAREAAEKLELEKKAEEERIVELARIAREATEKLEAEKRAEEDAIVAAAARTPQQEKLTLGLKKVQPELPELAEQADPETIARNIGDLSPIPGKPSVNDSTDKKVRFDDEQETIEPFPQAV